MDGRSHQAGAATFHLTFYLTPGHPHFKACARYVKDQVLHKKEVMLLAICTIESITFLLTGQ